MGLQVARGKAEVPRMETVSGVARYSGRSGNHMDWEGEESKAMSGF